MWQLIKEAVLRWYGANAPRLGAALAYYTILSMAPLVVVAVGIAGMVVGRQDAEGQLVAQIQGLIGEQSARAVQALLHHAFTPGGGIVATVVGVVALLFGASGVFLELRSSLNTLWEVPPAPNFGVVAFLRERAFSFALVLGIGFLLLVSLVVSASLAAATKFVGDRFPIPPPILELANAVVSIAVTTVLFGLIYRFVPDVKIPWRDVWMGGAVTALLFSAGKHLIGVYLGTASVVSAYGAAGSVVLILIWVYYSAQVFFLGAEFTRLFAEREGALPHVAHQPVSEPRRAA